MCYNSPGVRGWSKLKGAWPCWHVPSPQRAARVLPRRFSQPPSARIFPQQLRDVGPGQAPSLLVLTGFQMLVEPIRDALQAVGSQVGRAAARQPMAGFLRIAHKDHLALELPERGEELLGLCNWATQVSLAQPCEHNPRASRVFWQACTQLCAAWHDCWSCVLWRHPSQVAQPHRTSEPSAPATVVWLY